MSISRWMSSVLILAALTAVPTVSFGGGEPDIGGLIELEDMRALKRWCQGLPAIDAAWGNQNYWKGCGVLVNGRAPAYDRLAQTCFQGNEPGNEPIVISCAARCGAAAVVWAGYAWRDAEHTKLDACVFCECVGYQVAVDWQGRYLHSSNPPVSLDDLSSLDP